MKHRVVLISLGLLLTSSAHAKRLYGIAGCGLGNMVFGKDQNQIIAAITNATGSQTFGITSGTSQCSERSYHAESDVPRFVDDNTVAVEDSLARGEGESLDTVIELMGCPNNPEVKNHLRQLFTTYTSEATPAHTLGEHLVEAARSDSGIASKCLYL